MSSYNGLAAALKDFDEGARLVPLWWRLGLDQTAARYRRTLLGPFWIAASTIATGLALAAIFGGILGGNWREMVPFILTGVTVWAIISGVVVSGSQTFLGSSGQMQVQRLPLSFYVFLQMHGTLINFAHQLVAFWIVMLVLRAFRDPALADRLFVAADHGHRLLP
jgi:ABC-type polysaccharide/polyol phosphate export permease